MHAVEAGDRPRRRTHAGHGHAESLAHWRQCLGDQPDAENAHRLVMQKLRRPAPPLTRVLAADRAGQITRQRQHRAERCLRHRRPVDAPDIGHDDVLAQRRLIDEVVDAGAERLNPFQVWRLLQDFGGHHRREGDQSVGVRDMGPDLGMMVDQRHRHVGKALLQAVAVLLADRLGQAEQNEDIGHRGGYRHRAGLTSLAGCASLISSCAKPRQGVACEGNLG